MFFRFIRWILSSICLVDCAELDPQIGEDWLPTVAVINRVAEAGRVNNGQLQVVPKKDGVDLHSDFRLQTLGRTQTVNFGREKGFDQRRFPDSTWYFTTEDWRPLREGGSMKISEPLTPSCLCYIRKKGDMLEDVIEKLIPKEKVQAKTCSVICQLIHLKIIDCNDIILTWWDFNVSRITKIWFLIGSKCF